MQNRLHHNEKLSIKVFEKNGDRLDSGVSIVLQLVIERKMLVDRMDGGIIILQ